MQPVSLRRVFFVVVGSAAVQRVVLHTRIARAVRRSPGFTTLT